MTTLASSALHVGDMTTTELMQQLIDHGGSIVSARDLSEYEVEVAMADHRFAADASGNGFIRRIPERRPPQTTGALHMPRTFRR